MIEFGTENTVCGKFPPYIISCKELIGEGEPLNTLVIDVISANDHVIEKIE